MRNRFLRGYVVGLLIGAMLFFGLPIFIRWVRRCAL